MTMAPRLSHLEVQVRIRLRIMKDIPKIVWSIPRDNRSLSLALVETNQENSVWDDWDRYRWVVKNEKNHGSYAGVSTGPFCVPKGIYLKHVPCSTLNGCAAWVHAYSDRWDRVIVSFKTFYLLLERVIRLKIAYISETRACISRGKCKEDILGLSSDDYEVTEGLNQQGFRCSNYLHHCVSGST